MKKTSETVPVSIRLPVRIFMAAQRIAEKKEWTMTQVLTKMLNEALGEKTK